MISVLIVDDHPIFRSGLRSRLEKEADITAAGEAGTSDQAIVQARALQPDLVLLDLLMPAKSGCDTIPDLAKVSPRSRVLVLSSQAAPSAVREAIHAGAAGFIPKRASDTELVAAIRHVAAGERYVHPDVGAQLVVEDGLPALQPLSSRESEVLRLLALGYTNQEIGKKLFVSIRTVDTHRAHIMRKLRLKTRAELVLFSLSSGLIGAR
jgi:DNA-binding NarL/FixJ family response regulator